MPSEFDKFAAAFAVPALQSQFGERDSEGNLQTLIYSVEGSEPVVLPLISLSQVAFVVDFVPEVGDVQRRETRRALVAEADFAQLGKVSVGDQATTPDGDVWAVDPDNSQASGAVVVIGLARKPTMRHWEGRRANV